MKLTDFTRKVGTIGVNEGRTLFTPIKPLTIQITNIREDGVIYATLRSGDELEISATLAYIHDELDKIYENLCNEATNV